MSRDGVWGDELVLRAFSDAARARVCVHTPTGVVTYGSQYASDGTRHLRYDGVHYDVIVETSSA